MRRRPGIGAFAAEFWAFLGTGVVVGVVGNACDAIQPQSVASPPVNECPAHPCAGYQQSGPPPKCSDGGACFVAETRSDLLLVIGLAEDSILAPGRTYVTTLGRGGPGPTGPCAIQDCSPPTCVLQPWAEDFVTYAFEQAVADKFSWDLKNPRATLPVHVTYRRLLGATMVDAIDSGLPINPVLSGPDRSRSSPGPNGVNVPLYRAFMEDGCYERTVEPDLPFSTAFPPEIKLWHRNPGPSDGRFDVTTEETPLPMGSRATVPTFTIARAEGLDGWTAYLRNTATKRIFSNVARLSGSLAKNVVLATNHPRSVDALTGLELVLAPPPGKAVPTAVFAPFGSKVLAESEVYESMPIPMKISGVIADDGGTPVTANVVFTATAIYDPMGKPFPPNFEFVTQVSTTTDAQTGESVYSVILPQGDYVVVVRPRGSSALTTKKCTVSRQGGALPCGDILVGALVPVAGQALVADKRPLNDAIVEALPIQCGSTSSSNGAAFAASVVQSVAELSASQACMPTAAQTTTASDGSFSLSLDPGEYLLRVRAVEGSRLPWISRSLSVPIASGAISLGEMRVPAPVTVPMSLVDLGGNAIAKAVVRVFTDPTQGGRAVELGRAITDSAGYCEIVLAPGAR